MNDEPNRRDSGEREDAIRAIVDALLEAERERERAGLERLLNHLGLSDVFASTYGSVSEALLDEGAETIAWSLIGRNLAKQDPVFLNKRRGRPKKLPSEPSVDRQRYEFVQEARRRLKAIGENSYSDAAIIRALHADDKFLLFPKHVTEQTLIKSVSQGGND